MANQKGFTLIELMVAIAIIAVLSGIGIPSYQRYIQKAALTDMLQAIVPYKMAVELCFLEQSNLDNCNVGSHGIPAGQPSRYVSAVNVVKGVITLTGQNTLEGLSLTLLPTKNIDGNLAWARTCTATDGGITDSCKTVFRFNDKE
ncbi:MAG: hypothetical protein RL248_1349 [Pseudomonadota bacterium]